MPASATLTVERLFMGPNYKSLERNRPPAFPAVVGAVRERISRLRIADHPLLELRVFGKIGWRDGRGGVVAVVRKKSLRQSNAAVGEEHVRLVVVRPPGSGIGMAGVGGRQVAEVAEAIVIAGDEVGQV